MKILGIDFGTKRLGLAWADTVLDAVLPYGIIENKSVRLVPQKLIDLVAKEQLDRIVVGFPLGLSGQETPNTERVKEFAFELQKYTTAAVEFFDERFSSAAGDARGAGGASRDERAAMVILEGYLERTSR